MIAFDGLFVCSFIRLLVCAHASISVWLRSQTRGHTHQNGDRKKHHVRRIDTHKHTFIEYMYAHRNRNDKRNETKRNTFRCINKESNDDDDGESDDRGAERTDNRV